MTSLEMLQHAKEVISERAESYGSAAALFEQLAQRWSLTLGRQVTPQQVVLCLMDLKMVRLTHNPNHFDSQVDVAGYAALLSELTQGETYGG